MTTPSSPPISLHDVATELGISSAGLSLSDSRVRTLAGVSSGPISLHDLLAKSAYTPMSPNIGGDQGATATPFLHDFALSVSENGGAAPYAYFWTIVEGSESGPGTGSYISSTSAKSTTFEIEIEAPPGVFTIQVYCTVTDATSRSVDSNVITLAYACTS